jgi:uncharacterized protein
MEKLVIPWADQPRAENCQCARWSRTFCPATPEPHSARRGQNSVRAIFKIHRQKRSTEVDSFCFHWNMGEWMCMQQVCVIHGGHAHNSDQDYFFWLQNQEVRIDKEVLGWKQNLAKRLGGGFEVIRPTMPCKQNAKYVEWKIWFEKYLPLLKDDVILVGHSLGAIFLVKYLSENNLAVKIKATLLAAAPFSSSTHNPDGLADFSFGDDLSLFSSQAGDLVLFHSHDDLVVPFKETELFVAALPDVTLYPLEGRGHVNQETFPELEDKLRELAG